MLIQRLPLNTRQLFFHNGKPPAWRWRPRRRQQHRQRCFSFAAKGHPQSPVTTTTTTTSALAGATTELDRIAPRIDIRADQIQVLKGPEEFYEVLKSKIRGARKRIYLSTLYIGRSEHELVSTLREALLHNGSDLKVSILTDALRGTREAPEDASCASLLAPLVAEFPDRVEVRMYHTPNLTGLRKRLIPRRINEGWGLQHMKLYGMDDEVILSGANLSHDYFTNRQDRYHVFSSKHVTDYFARIHHTICSVSFLLLPRPSSAAEANKEKAKQGGKNDTFTLSWPTSNPAPSPLLNPQAYLKATTALLRPLVSPLPPSPPSEPSPSPHIPQTTSTTTSIYPIISHPPTLNTELPALRALFSSGAISSYTFAAGYFNPHPLITSSLITCSSSSSSSPSSSSSLSPPNIPIPTPTSPKNKILTAHPSANGFYHSRGLSGLLPAAYSHLSLLFLRSIPPESQSQMRLYEWQRPSTPTLPLTQPPQPQPPPQNPWTFHAKGLWLYLISSSSPPAPQAQGPNITILGSSNYTTRSYALDLEVGAIVLTRDEALMRRWGQEESELMRWAREVREEELCEENRKAGWGVRGAMWLVRVLGGAL